jgi:hypothetical protein
MRIQLHQTRRSLFIVIKIKEWKNSLFIVIKIKEWKNIPINLNLQMME